MTMKKMMAVLRFLLLIAAGVLIIVSMKWPMWYMYLDSNNFPKGIGMAVWATHPGDPADIDELDGGLKEVNILNHYIGMREISKETMVVFSILPVLLVLSAILSGVTAFIRRLWLTTVNFLFMAAISAWGLFMLVYSLYSFGHNLDPEAAITVPPFMPGLYGENKLAQFTTYSDFYWGTYLLIAAVLLMLAALVIDFFSLRRVPEPSRTGGENKE
jgi:copper chaperone NosL